MNLDRGHRNLRKGRVSIAGARYFLTLCINHRKAHLANNELFQFNLEQFAQLSEEGACDIIACVFMPDHMHLLIKLTEEHSLSEIVRLYKGRMSTILRKYSLRWQKGSFYDHRLRPEDELAPVIRYMFNNPYAKKLIPLDQKWPFWYCEPSTWIWFSKICKENLADPEWIKSHKT